MERSDPHALRRATDQPCNAVAHLAGGLVRERNGEDPVRRDILRFDQARNPGREHTRLARPRPCQHQQRTMGVHDCVVLGAVQPGER